MRTRIKVALCVLLALFAAISLTAVLADLGLFRDEEAPSAAAEMVETIRLLENTGP